MIKITSSTYKKAHQQLLQWYHKNKRSLPWRLDQDPYKIWLSEVMLQQTTVVAVIPYFDKFLKLFPNVKVLAKSPIELVLENWAGLGYYSRARNLHEAAKFFAKNGFPQQAIELEKVKGIGPYTSRAVASIAFNDPVGVLDGNVIRVLTRYFGLKINWWETASKKLLQSMADELAQRGDSGATNQALMELGATICTPQKTSCPLCPWAATCQAFEKNMVKDLPLKKQKRSSEIWLWNVHLIEKDKKLALTKNDYLPFLKGTYIFPGTAEKLSAKPEDFDLNHSITHHKIYIKISTNKKNKLLKETLFVHPQEMAKINPSSVLKKIQQKAKELN
jgi:A/G-specific adenine glycosylase